MISQFSRLAKAFAGWIPVDRAKTAKHRSRMSRQRRSTTVPFQKRGGSWRSFAEKAERRSAIRCRSSAQLVLSHRDACTTESCCDVGIREVLSGSG